MKKEVKTETINGKVFHVPSDEVYCKKCKTTNYFYDDDLPPYKCDTCGKVLVKLRPDPPYKNNPFAG